MTSSSFRVLLVEDDPGDAELTRIGLSRTGSDIDLEVVGSGQAALHYLHQQGDYRDAPRPDLIFLDLNLPGLSGKEVLKTIKQEPHLKSIPIVVLTTSSAAQDITESYLLGANCYIKKAMDLQKFMDKISELQRFWFTTVELPT